jgi:iron(III) transport system permease protein
MFWENFFKNTINLVGIQAQTGMLQAITGLGTPAALVYGFWPCALCLGIHYAPFAYILIGGILRNMDANLEEAATILKASRMKILRKITLPIVMPALLSTVLLVFASSISSYTVPMFLGKDGYMTISLKMRALFNSSSLVGQGYVVATILMLFSIGIMLANQHISTGRKSFTTVTGKSSQVSLIRLKKPFKIFITTIVLAYTIFFAIVPLVSFALESFLEVSGSYDKFTLYYWITKEETNVYISGSVGILHNEVIWKAYGTSLLISLVVALIAGTFGILIGYAVAKNKGKKLSNFVSNVSFLPYLIPAMSFSTIYLAVSSSSLFSFLYRSIPLLIIVGSIKFLPFATRSGTNAMLQLSNEIEEAAIIVGVPWWKRMVRVLFPIQKSSFISGYLLPFISCMRELSLFVLLTSSSTILTAVLSNYETYDSTQISNGINLIIIVTVLVINLITNKVTGASIDKGVGG